jgi:hypothetical protein
MKAQFVYEEVILDQGFIQNWEVLSPNSNIEYLKIGHARIYQHYSPFDRS